VTTTFPSGPGQVTPSWRDERRQDRLAQAEAAERHADAQQKRQFAEADKARQLKALDREARRAAKIAARQDRAGQLTAAGQWCRRRAEFLVMIPVIGVPGGLAWTGMADYGYQQYGTPGLALPAFSEAAMWIFAMRTTAVRKRDPEAPIWHLRLGTVVFTGVSGALNFLHGLSTGGVVSGITMALISMAGVIAHQITTAGPRKTRQQRRADRIARKTARKQKRAEAAAINAGIVVIGTDGQARVTVRPGAAALRRRWPMRTRLVPERDVQAEINDITDTALLLVTRAEEEASKAYGQSERCAETVRETRQQAARQVEEADARAELAEERAQEAERSAAAAIAEARELTEQARRAASAALTRASAAEARTAQVETETRAGLERAARETVTAAAETDKARNAYQSAMQSLAAVQYQAERARAAEEAALARAAAAEEEITQAKAREKRPGETKKDHLLRLYRAHPDYGVTTAASKTATELAAVVECSPGSARRDVREHLRETGVLAASSAAEMESESGDQGEEDAA
jgi:hypothetical protein